VNARAGETTATSAAPAGAGEFRGKSCVVIDNYDSFTFNLVQYLQIIGFEVSVLRNDEKSASDVLREARAAGQRFILISPGPSSPDEAGICVGLIRLAARDRFPLFGVCLGHQAIGQALGGKVVRAEYPVHGKTARIAHSGNGVFAGLPSPFRATRYHSLVVERTTLPGELEISAWLDHDADQLIMGLQHRTLPIAGVQFHPESVLTEHGLAMLGNFSRQL